ncbi:MAG: sodium:proton exchanger [Robiginitomaculum sp.]|nr:MAG: sodium:proton exchanger [Robiginitomaculum sp.]
MSEVAHIASQYLPYKIALIGVLGIGAQWLAWRLQRPAIVLMAAAGLIFGPGMSWIFTLDFVQTQETLRNIVDAFRLNPEKDFGEMYRPMVGIAVAIILFEGGLNLRFKDLRDATHAVSRMVLVAAPIAWVLGTIAAHMIVGLPWDISAMIGGLFIVTGPTVILPLLRQAHLPGRPAAILKWEGIVNDPLGALFAVAGYTFIRFTAMGENILFAIVQLVVAALIGAWFGAVSGWGLAWAFRRGDVPEYLKAPVVLVWVLAIYVMANSIADETGLVAVTALGIAMANSKFAAMVEMRRFKENIAVLLVSGVFVVLTATLTPEVLQSMDWRVMVFVLAMMFIVRPVAVFVSTIWSGLSWRETLLVSWIAPRGVVAVAVAGLFATELQLIGRPEGAIFVPLAFALVFATVLTSSFTITPLSKWLGFAKKMDEGVLIVGANPWSLGLAKALKDMDIPVLIADTNWRRLRGARLDGLTVFYGEVLSENADHRLDHSTFEYLIAATPNDAYNALVCVEFAPELGRHRVFQISGQEQEEADPAAINFTARGRTLSTHGRSFDVLTRDWWSGWRFRSTTLSDEYTFDNFTRDRGEDIDILLAKRPDGSLDFLNPEQKSKIDDSTLLSFGPVRAETTERTERIERSEGAANTATLTDSTAPKGSPST